MGATNRGSNVTVKRNVLSLLFFMAGLTAGSSSLTAQSANGSTCRSATDADVLTIKGWAVGHATGSDSLAVVDRAATGIPSAPADSAFVVIGQPWCTVLSAKYAAAVNRPVMARSIAVLRVKDRYIVLDPSVRFGQYYVVVVFQLLPPTSPGIDLLKLSVNLL